MAIESDVLRVIGTPASPYTRKMLSLLRYRQIPYQIRWQDGPDALAELGIEAPRPLLVPVIIMPGSTVAQCDSTPLIRELETRYTQRSVIPDDAALAFIDYLIEDYADEWCTKPMFHFRWYFDADADNCGNLLKLLLNPSTPHEEWQEHKKIFSKRQIDRLHVVGSNDVTASMISDSYQRLLRILEAHLAEHAFMLGERPSACDFGLSGQLSQLTLFDPTPRAMAEADGPRTLAWTMRMDDLGGLEPREADWLAADAFPETLKALLGEIGRCYVPAMLANEQAMAAKQETWQTEIDGQRWEQRTFPYQGKCLRWLRERYVALSEADRQRVDVMLAGTGCEALFV